MNEKPPIDSLWDFSVPAASEQRFRERAESETGEIWLELQTQIARALGLQGKVAEGHLVLDEIESKPGGRQLVRCLLERGRLFNSAGERVKAVEFFRAADAEAQLNGEIPLRIDALHMLGIAAPSDQQEHWHLAAIKVAEESSIPEAKRWLGSLLNNLAWTYFDAGEHQKALNLFERALVWNMEFGTSRTIQIAQWSVGRALRAACEVHLALEIQLTLNDEIGDENPDGYVYEEIAECLVALDRIDESRPWFKKAFETLSADTWFAEHEPVRLARLHSLANSDQTQVFNQ